MSSDIAVMEPISETAGTQSSAPQMPQATKDVPDASHAARLDDADHAPDDNTLPSMEELLAELQREGGSLEHEDLSSKGDDWDEDSADEWDGEPIRPEDEDWEIAEKDFTKQYNRLRQHAAVHNGTATAGGKPKAQPTGGTANAVVSLPPVNKPRKPNAPAAPVVTAVQSSAPIVSDQLALLQKYNVRLSKISESYVDQLGMGAGVNRKGPSATANKKDKADRATTEQVLDPRTRLILYKMIGRGVIFEVNGCISTGKEANVYHGFTPAQSHLAIKIYKTSILVFKDRDRYVTGEFRFRKGYSRHNPRKMVRLWAEKEMRNLKRLSASGLRCPEPIEVRENVLVMTFLGDEEGWASPRLKDAVIPDSAIQPLYIEMLILLRRLYHSCKLVHADLSEYNLLYHLGHLYVIDVSQSVEHDHPHALDFLRSDITNVEDFWGKRGVKTLGLRRTFEWVVSESGAIGLQHEDVRRKDKESKPTGDEAQGTKSTLPLAPKESNVDQYAESDAYTEMERVLEEWLAKELPPLDDGSSLEQDSLSSPSNTLINSAQEDAVFRSSYIPRNLTEVVDPERDLEVLARGDGKSLIYGGLTGVVAKYEEGDKKEGLAEGDEEDEEDLDEADGDDDEESGNVTKVPKGLRHEEKEAKKERQRLLKEEARERRKTKMPKAEKQQKVKRTKRW